ncbi:GMP/IMP nucleotidase [Flocculibacter collagenilyticus]|uniref:GMP/IMP nucleotidase n=1 Tax=Flocculibacter collagenilyticus TaxID=2744479 RepID=UPI0018F35911|nr:GMP/IMP nucleotidase [Flocculibacter collagenilyticus]
MLQWEKIHTVLLDMDGTLLDLHFDNHFWLTLLPQRYAEQENITLEQAQQFLKNEYQQVSGQIQWYCLDYWTEKLNLPITALKREIDHLIAIRQDTIPFLDALKQSGREVILVTNAHPDSLSLKIEKTKLDQHIDTLVSTHQYGVTKESQQLWQQLQAEFNFNNKHTLFVDDSIDILKSAQQYGIKHLLAVANPDSQQATKHITEFDAVSDYRVLVEDILNYKLE